MIPGKESLLKETVPELIKIHHKFEVYELPKPIVDVDSIFRTAFLPESIKAINQNNKETDKNLVESLIKFPLPPIFRDEDDTNELQISRRQKKIEKSKMHPPIIGTIDSQNANCQNSDLPVKINSTINLGESENGNQHNHPNQTRSISVEFSQILKTFDLKIDANTQLYNDLKDIISTSPHDLALKGMNITSKNGFTLHLAQNGISLVCSGNRGSRCRAKVNIIQTKDGIFRFQFEKGHYQSCLGVKTFPTSYITTIIDSHPDVVDSCTHAQFYKNHILKNASSDDISYQRVNRACNKLQLRDKDSRYDKFTTILSLLKYLKEEHGATTQIILSDEIIPRDDYDNIIKNFKKVVIKHFAITPYHSKLLLQSKAFCGILLIDGTFIFGICGGCFIITGTITPNKRFIPLTFGWSYSENSDATSLILDQLNTCSAKDSVKVIFSDQGTALKKSIPKTFPLAEERDCMFHITEKILYSEICQLIKDLFRSKHPDDWNANIQLLEKNLKPTIIELLQKNNIFELKQYDAGLIATSVIESFNSILSSFKKDEIFDLILKTYNYGFDRVMELKKGEFTKIKYDERVVRIQNFYKSQQIPIYKDGTRIVVKLDGKNYIITTDGNKVLCTCNRMVRLGRSCIHVILAAQKFKELEFCLDMRPSYLDYNQFQNDFDDLLKSHIDPSKIPIIDCIAIPVTQIPLTTKDTSRKISFAEQLKRKAMRN